MLISFLLLCTSPSSVQLAHAGGVCGASLCGGSGPAGSPIVSASGVTPVAATVGVPVTLTSTLTNSGGTSIMGTHYYGGTPVTINSYTNDFVVTSNPVWQTTTNPAVVPPHVPETVSGCTAVIDPTTGSFTGWSGCIYSYATAGSYTDIGTTPGTDIQPSSSVTTTHSYTFTTPGTYYVDVIPDSTGQITIPPLYLGLYSTYYPQMANGAMPTGGWTAITVTNPTSANLHPTGLSPVPAIGGVATTFIGTIQNSGAVVAAPFTSALYICQVGDTTCENAGTAAAKSIEGLSIGSSWKDKLFAFLGISIARAASSPITLGPTGINAKSSGTQNAQTTYTFPAGGGSYEYLLCADNQGTVPVTDKTTLCNSWTSLKVNPVLSATCTTNQNPAITNQSMTWSSSPTGGATPYTYTWGGSVVGSTQNVTMSYSSAGTYTGQVTVHSSDGQSFTANCSPGTGGNPLSVASCQPAFSASPTTVNLGQTTSLIWSEPTACGVSSCTLSDGFTAGLSGSHTVTPPAPSSGTTDPYSVMCGVASNTTNATVTVNVPTVTLSASAQRIASGGTVNLTWNGQNVTSCSITRNGVAWGPGNATSGTNIPDATPITTQTTYVASCTAASSPSPAQATVNVIPQYSNF